MNNLVLSATTLFAIVALAAASSHDNFSISIHGQVRSCNDIEVRWNDDDSVTRGEQQLTIPQSQVQTLAVKSGGFRGIEVRGEDRNDYLVTACKAAAAAGESSADAVVQQISVALSGSELRVQGPTPREKWMVYLIIQAPRSASLDLAQTNGPIGLRDLAGKVKAESTNGPISLKNVSGEVDARAQNGPISISSGGGNLHVSTQNGPIEVALLGQRWDGAGLEASAINGPLSVQVPANYQSGVLVESKGHGPMSCRASVCEQARKTWEEDVRRIEFGSNPVVRVSSVNGPVAVKSKVGEL